MANEEIINKVEEKKPFKKRIRNFFLKILLYGILLYGIYTLVVYFYPYSDGWRAGSLSKFSKKGIIFKTHEGDVYLKATADDGGMNIVNRNWKFSVDGSQTKVIDILNQNAGAEFKFHYVQKLTTLFWRGDAEYFVDEVQLVK